MPAPSTGHALHKVLFASLLWQCAFAHVPKLADQQSRHQFDSSHWDTPQATGAVFMDEGGWGGAARALMAPAIAMLPKTRFFVNATGAAAEPGTAGEVEGRFDHTAFHLEMDVQRRPHRRRCRATVGQWCGRYERQHPVPFALAPRGDRQCAANCNNVGSCDHDLGVCRCPAGWGGPDCTTPDKRYCMGQKHDPGPYQTTMSHVDEDGRDLGWTIPGWRASRCGGICDIDTSQCWCDGGISKYGRIGPPKGSPAGTPPVQIGRPLGEQCKPKQDALGRETGWGNKPYAQLYGPDGWCNADKPVGENSGCGCQLDWLTGRFCEEILESACVNQCSGRGTCSTGFCKCHEGWYGSDCSRKRAALAIEPNDLESGARPWLAGTVVPTAAAVTPMPADGGSRKRPLIYVYDTPAPFTSRMLQYRLYRNKCVWRHFTGGNKTIINDNLYAQELYIHEMLLASPHRTFDPEEADFFYVPAYVTCLIWPVWDWADAPFWGAPTGPRVMHASQMTAAVLVWIKATYGKYWERRQGRDHIWLMPHDEGACWAQTEIYNNSIILTHWGRMDAGHKSNTNYPLDNYDQQVSHYPAFQPWDWRVNISNHVCYDPVKDLVIPSLKPPSHYQYSGLLGHPPMQRDILLYFKGDVGLRRDKCRADAPERCYSRGIRQNIHRLSLELKWREKYNIFVGAGGDPAMEGAYSQQLARSLFCLVAPGDGWSARAEDSMLHGCIPVVVMDKVHTVFESILDWDTFSVRVAQDAIQNLPTILLAITPQQLTRMQRRIGTVWHRFAYAQSPVYAAAMKEEYGKNRPRHGPEAVVPPHHPLPVLTDFPVEEDAFSTIIQWLYARIPHTRGTSGPDPGRGGGPTDAHA